MTSSKLKTQPLPLRLKNLSDRDAWEEFIETYHDYIYYFLRQYKVHKNDLDDFYQKTILKCIEKIHTFKCHENGRGFNSWIKVIVHNEVYNERKRNIMIKDKINKIKPITEIFIDPHIENKIEKEWEETIFKQAWGNIEKKLKPDHKASFQLLLNGASVDETSLQLNISSQNIYTYKKRIQEKLVGEVRRLKNIAL